MFVSYEVIPNTFYHAPDPYVLEDGKYTCQVCKLTVRSILAEHARSQLSNHERMVNNF